VAVLKTLGFTRRSVLGSICERGGGAVSRWGLIGFFLGWIMILRTYPFQAVHFFFPMKVTPGMCGLALLTARICGVGECRVPSYHASKVNIVDGFATHRMKSGLKSGLKSG